MWFADVGQVIAWFVAAAWALVATIAMSMRRTALGAVLAPVARLPVLVGMTVATAMLVAQAVVVDFVADLGRPGHLDTSVWAWFVDNRSPVMTFLMKAVSLLGDTPEMALLALLGAVVLLWAGYRTEAAVVLTAPVGALLLINGFKNLYDRPRPPVGERLAIEGNPSLPSGHALGSVVVIGVLAAVVVLLMRSLALRVLAVVAAAVLVATIGISRLYLAVHWTTDVLAGWFLGGAWLALCVTVLCVARTPTRTPDLLSPAGAVPAGSGRRG